MFDARQMLVESAERSSDLGSSAAEVNRIDRTIISTPLLPPLAASRCLPSTKKPRRHTSSSCVARTIFGNFSLAELLIRSENEPFYRTSRVTTLGRKRRQRD